MIIKKYRSLFLLAFALPVVAAAQVRGVHLSWNGISSSTTATTMAITWMSDAKGYETVCYGTDSTKLDKKLIAKEDYSADMKAYLLKATLTRLKPGTCYYYRIGDGRSGSSNIYSFRTAGKTGSSATFTVGVWSDTQDNKGNLSFEQTDSIVAKLAAYPLHFTLHTGDIVENGSVQRSWNNFFETAQPLNARFPFMSVTGNHDVINDRQAGQFQKPFPVYYDLFNLPNDQLNYSYDYGNTHFVAINSGYAKGAEKDSLVYFKPGSAEYKWLEKDLAKARRSKHIRWIVLYCHYPMYAYGVSQVEQWQQHITPLLDKFGVDLCISGHRHVYERHQAVKAGVPTGVKDRHIYDQPAGTVYITNGSAGGSLQGTGGKDLPTMIFTPSEKIYTYGTLVISPHEIRMDVYEKSGRKIDYFTIRKEKK
ncbi:MAG: purple acid phosphatase family protein [Chitinophagaceae bacterium]